MSLGTLEKMITDLDFDTNEIAIPLELFFDGNTVVGSIIPNSYPNKVDPQVLYKDLINIKSLDVVSDIFVRIADFDDEEWPFADSIYIITSLSVEGIMELLKDYSPDEVSEGWMYGKPAGIPDELSSGNVITVWWD